MCAQTLPPPHAEGLVLSDLRWDCLGLENNLGQQSANTDLSAQASPHTTRTVTYKQDGFTHSSAPLPRAVENALVLSLQTQFLQPGILGVVDEKVGGGVTLGATHGSQERGTEEKSLSRREQSKGHAAGAPRKISTNGVS